MEWTDTVGARQTDHQTNKSNHLCAILFFDHWGLDWAVIDGAEQIDASSEKRVWEELG